MTTNQNTPPAHHEQYGALPTTPTVSPSLLGLIQSGRVFSLQQTMRSSMPQWAAQPAYALTSALTHEASAAIMSRPVTGSFEKIEHSGHSGTHIDALCHIGCWHDEAVYLHGDVPVSSLAAAEGYSDLGAEHFPPIIMRGILLDVAGAKGRDQLPDLYEITADDLRECELRQGVAIAPETVVLVRSGFENYWGADPARYMGQGAGPGPQAARYLAERGTVATGSDTANYELLAFPDLPVHHYLLYERGIFIMENLRLNELAAAGAHEFLFVALPIAFGGATGSSIHPIAIT